MLQKLFKLGENIYDEQIFHTLVEIIALLVHDTFCIVTVINFQLISQLWLYYYEIDVPQQGGAS